MELLVMFKAVSTIVLMCVGEIAISFVFIMDALYLYVNIQRVHQWDTRLHFIACSRSTIRHDIGEPGGLLSF